MDSNETIAWIGVENVEINAAIGVFPFERVQGNDFLVCLEVELRQHTAFSTDSLADTVDYIMLHQSILAGFSSPVHLIEHVAWKIVKFLQTTLSGYRYKLKIQKKNPSIPGGMIGNSILRLEGVL
jgi:dihydroneopterin aldolase